jgi:hypothetical protein
MLNNEHFGEHFGSLMVQSINSAADAVMTGGSGSQMRVSHVVSLSGKRDGKRLSNSRQFSMSFRLKKKKSFQ